jgi:hypothetical protein
LSETRGLRGEPMYQLGIKVMFAISPVCCTVKQDSIFHLCVIA